MNCIMEFSCFQRLARHGFISAIDTQVIDRFINALAWTAKRVASVDAWFDRVVVDGIVNLAGRATWKAGA